MVSRILFSELKLRLDIVVEGHMAQGDIVSLNHWGLISPLPLPSLVPLCSQPRGWCHPHSRQVLSIWVNFLGKYSNSSSQGIISIQSRLPIMVSHQASVN